MPSAKTVWFPGPLRIDVLLTEEDTSGAMCVIEDHPPPGWALPAHSHEVAETIYVIEGETEMVVGGQAVLLTAGEIVHIPAGVPHSGSTEAGARRLVTFSPAGMERFFLEAGADRPGDAADPARLAALAMRHGWRFD